MFLTQARVEGLRMFSDEAGEFEPWKTVYLCCVLYT